MLTAIAAVLFLLACIAGFLWWEHRSERPPRVQPTIRRLEPRPYDEVVPIADPHGYLPSAYAREVPMTRGPVVAPSPAPAVPLPREPLTLPADSYVPPRDALVIAGTFGGADEPTPETQLPEGAVPADFLPRLDDARSDLRCRVTHPVTTSRCEECAGHGGDHTIRSRVAPYGVLVRWG